MLLVVVGRVCAEGKQFHCSRALTEREPFFYRSIDLPFIFRCVLCGGCAFPSPSLSLFISLFLSLCRYIAFVVSARRAACTQCILNCLDYIYGYGAQTIEIIILKSVYVTIVICLHFICVNASVCVCARELAAFV